MTQIDWSKAPADATHWDANPNRVGSFMKLECCNWFFWPVGATLEARWHAWNREGRNDLTGLVPRPSPWNGEGLPPVGLEIEVLWSSQCGTYVRGKVVAHDDGRAVFRFLDGERTGEYQAERVSTYNDGQFTNFRPIRPIRTAEQVAAEQRENGVQQMVDAISWGAHVPETRRKIAYDLYDAGARMPAQGQKV